MKREREEERKKRFSPFLFHKLFVDGCVDIVWSEKNVNTAESASKGMNYERNEPIELDEM